MHYLQEDTGVTINFGPFLDKGGLGSGSGGTVPVTSHQFRASGISLSKNGGSIAARNSTNAVRHEHQGWYRVRLSSTDTDTVGHLDVMSATSLALPVWTQFTVVTAAAHNAIYGVAGLIGNLNAKVSAVTASTTGVSGALTAKITGLSNSLWARLTGLSYNIGTKIDQMEVSTAVSNPSEIWAHTVRTLTGTAGISGLSSDVMGTDTVDLTGLSNSLWARMSGISYSVGTKIDQMEVSTAVSNPSEIWGYSVRVLTGTAGISGLSTNTDVASSAVSASLQNSVWRNPERLLTGTGGISGLSTNSDVASSAVSGSLQKSVWRNTERLLTGTGGISGISTNMDTLLSGVSDSIGGKLAGVSGSLGTGIDQNTNAQITAVSTYVSGVLNTVTIAEMSASAPPVQPTIAQLLNFMYRPLRNKTTTRATGISILADDGSTVLYKSTISDDNTIFTKGEFESG